jgi:hypothetical protein
MHGNDSMVSPQTTAVIGWLCLLDQQVALRWPFGEMIGGKTA